ncbi:MAG: lytic murein transglycosylase [Pseudomonadota bacterium]
MSNPYLHRRRRSRCAIALLTIAAVAGCASAPVATPAAPASAAAVDPAARDAAALEQRFTRWIADTRVRARAAGIDEATLERAFADVRYLPRVVELDRAQPEFTRTVWSYLDTAVSAQRVEQGQRRLAEIRPVADAAAARYGVPASLVVAIWGIESNYGANFGDIPTIDALATLGVEGRREAWARSELLAALRILQNGDIARAQMIGSWAGAMGQTQFLPSVFLAHAVDADGDGRRDIWGSMADVTASTAAFIAHSGWQPGQPWGTEVTLPPGFDPGRADSALRLPASQWAAEGVRAADGAPLPDLTDVAVLLPAGARGPAFLVGANFRAILRYNNSTSYALAVGLLAQRIAGGPAVQAPWPRELAALSRSQVSALQTALNERGFPAGTVDGLMGPATQGALRGWQRSAGLPADGFPTLELLQKLTTP